MFLKKSKKAPSKYYLWVLLGIIVFGLILWVWQSWKSRLPENPRQAVAEVMERMEKFKSVDLEIKHRLTAAESDPVEVSAMVKYRQPDEYQGRMLIVGPEAFIQELPFSPEQEFARIQNKNYTRDLDQADWEDHSNDPDYVPFLKIDPLAFLRFSLANGEPVREKDDTIMGVTYAVYSFGYPAEKLAESLKPFGLLIDEIPDQAEVRGKIWFDPLTRLLFRQQVAVTIPEIGGEEVTTNFSNYDGILIFSTMDSIVASTPATSAASDAQAVQDREERNQKRQIDLLAIKAALEKIYDDDHSYPESSQAVNLSQDQAEVHQKLLKYLKEIPADPQAPQYYYAYRCTGGEQYELTGIQETEAGNPRVIMLDQSYDYFKDKP